NAQYVAWVINTMPRQLAHMDQAVCAAKIDERAEIAQSRDRAAHDVALFEFREQTRLLLRTPFTLCFTLAEDQTTPRLINFDDFDGKHLILQFVPRFAPACRADSDKMRTWDEALKP